MRRVRAVAAIVAIGILPGGAAALQLPPDSAILGMLRERVEAKAVTGIVAGVMGPDGKARVVAYGPAREGGPALDARSVLEIGSVSKTFTAAILADMLAKGEVKLDDPVAKYLPPAVKVPSRNGKEITLLDLATQTSGLPRMPSNFQPKDPANPYADYTPEQMYEFLSGYELPRDPGATYEYSNLGMGLLGFALARRAGSDYEAVLKRRVLAPLGMSSTGIALTPDMRARLAPGHDPSGAVVSNWDIPTLAGAGAIRSDMEDMLRYLRANMFPESSPVAKELATTHEPRRPVGGGGMRIGLAWHVLPRPDGEIVWHNGQTAGYHGFIAFRPGTKSGVVLLTNTGADVDDIGMHILDAGIPLRKPSAPVARKEITLPPEVLDRYVGEYRFAPTFSIVVSREGPQLFAQPTGQQRVPLFAETETDFFLKVVDAQLRFTRDAAGKVTGAVLHQGGGNAPGAKVK